MRRGQRNKWTHDNAPNDGGLVTICEDGNCLQFYSAEDIRSYRKAKATGVSRSRDAKLLDNLRKFGWL